MGKINYLYNSEEIENEKRESKDRKWMIGLIITITTGVVLMVVPSLIGLELSDWYYTYVMLAIFLTIMGALLYRYLQKENLPRNQQEQNGKLAQELNSIKLDMMLLKEKTGVKLDPDYLADQIDEIVSKTLDEEFLQSKIEDIYRKTSTEHTKATFIEEGLESIQFRIKNEIFRLKRSGTINLVFGVITTFVALLCIVYMFKGAHNFKEGSTQFLIEYLPRLSIAVFIEIFAFFFLRLYKVNLSDIRYYNNELLTVELKLTALSVATREGNMESIDFCLKEVVSSERNVVLKQNETTVELMKRKVENEDFKSLTKILSRLTEKPIK